MDEIRLIDANALKEKLLNSFCHIYGRRSGKTFTKEMIEKVFQVIDKTPTVTNGTYEQGFRVGAYGRLDEIRPHGEWIIEKETTFEFYMKCSNCDAPAEWLDGESQLLSNYCPNCGADMRPKKKLQTPSCLTNPERQAELLERYKEE